MVVDIPQDPVIKAPLVDTDADKGDAQDQKNRSNDGQDDEDIELGAGGVEYKALTGPIGQEEEDQAEDQ